MSILSVNTIIPFSNSNIEIESGSIQGNVIGTTTTASYVQLQNVDGHTEFSQSVATALENTDSFPYTGSAAISGSLTFSSDSNFIPPKGTENQKPSNPEAGTFYYNTDNGNVEVYTGNIWAILSFENVMSAGTAVGSTEVFDGNTVFYPSATGGTVTDITINGLNYRVHAFTETDSFIVNSGGSFEYLIVAGGGSCVGNQYHSGGGGAGGLLTGTVSLDAQTYTITVGAGAPPSGNGQRGGNGSNSSAFGLVAIGGGGAGGYQTNPNDGKNGGSGGGAGTESGVTATGGSGTTGQGNNGGSVNGTHPGAAGGGGAGAAGGNGTNSGPGGSGGIGLYIDWADVAGYGESGYFAGGGGGSNTSNPYVDTPGGLGGGGNGNYTTGNPGLVNTGGGAGGPERQSGTSLAAGGSGIVLVRYIII